MLRDGQFCYVFCPCIPPKTCLQLSRSYLTHKINFPVLYILHQNEKWTVLELLEECYDLLFNFARSMFAVIYSKGNCIYNLKQKTCSCIQTQVQSNV